ncbi:hypothetical protein CYY_006501 [Polysphondylium violaceum]|uniref:Type A von Willebrand factor domain-containing protein n=1 Tax=Polysphondylium violaceum TaxID=133409 RepID=A0A8J4URG6_9MYCE|nr:hypothetical protein CYY_006501 [Polysphondylium violaceum]
MEKVSVLEESTFYSGYYELLKDEFDSINYQNNNIVGLASCSNNLNRHQQQLFCLHRFDIDSDITDTSTSTVFSQYYKNNYDVPVEARYSIPLPPFSTISAFEIEYPRGKQYKAIIRDRLEAVDQYSDGVADGCLSFMAEISNIGIFDLYLGNIYPSCPSLDDDNDYDIVVHITIISEIGICQSDYHYFIHECWFPDYSFTFNFKSNIYLSAPIKNLSMNTSLMDDSNHEIVYNDSKTSATVTLSTTFNNINNNNNNLLLIISPELSNQPHSLIEYNSKTSSYGVSISFYNNSSSSLSNQYVNQRSEYIYLVDCSNSMKGDPIEKVVLSLEIIVKSLNENCKFNIICFGSSYIQCFDESTMYTTQSVAIAREFIKKSIKANLSGTQLYEPLRHIIQQPYDPLYPRQLFIITDGQVSDRPECISLLLHESESTRIFSLGIGKKVDRGLVMGLTSACRGYFEFIVDNNEIQRKVMKLINISMEPIISNIKFNWQGLDIKSSDTHRPMFFNERLLIYGLIEDASIEDSNLCRTVELTGNDQFGKEICYKVNLDFKSCNSTKHKSTISLATKRIINHLEQQELKFKINNDQEIKRLSKKHSILSTKTSFIVSILDPDKVTDNSMINVNILKKKKPVLVDRIHSFSGYWRDNNSHNNSNNNNSHNNSNINNSHQNSSNDSFFQKVVKNISNIFMNKNNSSNSGSIRTNNIDNNINNINNNNSNSNSSPHANNNDNLIELIKLQNINGSWSQINNLLPIPKIPFDFKIDDDVWTTLIVICKIKNEYSNRKIEWAILIQKSMNWITEYLIKNNLDHSIDSLLQIANSHI